MVKIALLGFVLSHAISSYGQDSSAEGGGGPGLSPQKWFEEYLEYHRGNPDKVGVFPMTLVIVDKFNNKKPPKLASFKSQDLERMGLLRVGESLSLKTFYRLNEKPKGVDKKKPRLKKDKDWIASLFSATGSDLVIDGSGSTWQAHIRKGDDIESPYSGAKPKSLSGKDIHQWVTKDLNYDGVILDQKGSYFLVGTYTNLTSPGIQALAAMDSASQYKIPEKFEGGGLLELKVAAPNAGIFELIVPGKLGQNLPKGTKIVIQKK